MLSEEALVKAVKRALLSQSDDGMVKELLVIHERERLSQRFDAINKIHGKSATDLMEDDVSSRHDLVKKKLAFKVSSTRFPLPKSLSRGPVRKTHNRGNQSQPLASSSVTSEGFIFDESVFIAFHTLLVILVVLAGVG